MTPPVGETAVAIAVETTKADPRTVIKAFAFVSCFGIVAALVYLLSTRSVTEDRYTSSDHNAYSKAIDSRRSDDIRDQERVNSQWRESNAAIKATLDALDQRTKRIEAKIDAK